MLDMGTSEGRIISAALRLAAERPWNEVSLREIAEAAGMNLAGLSDTYSSKSEILGAFVKQVDREVLSNAPAPQPGESQRDALFEVIMARFDILAPYKSALSSIVKSGETELPLIRTMLSSQAWMLQAAGIDSDGPAGGLRTAGLASVYTSVLRTWLEDDDPGLARTMAALDRRLRRGESAMSVLDDMLGAARRIKDVLRSGWRPSEPKTAAPAEDEFGGDAAAPGAGPQGGAV
jgi:ubiquinone biosynthesis protein COQ9